jgi:hypothetical protein
MADSRALALSTQPADDTFILYASPESERQNSVLVSYSPVSAAGRTETRLRQARAL